MDPLGEYLKDAEYANWVKSGLALNIANEVLRPFVVNEITKLHTSIVETLPPLVLCTGCQINTGCHKGICDKIQRRIEHEHWYPRPSFTNTCTGRWRKEPWEIAKCYMQPSKGSKNISALNADFTACISVIINCKHFMPFGTSDPRDTETDISKSREFRNSVMHASPQKVSEDKMKENLDILISILNKVKTSKTEAATEEAIKKIETIKTNRLKLTLKNVIEVRKNATEAIADIPEKGKEQVQRERLIVNFEAGCRKVLCRLTAEHIKKQKLSVADFLSKIRILDETKDLCQRHQHMLFPTSGTHPDITDWDLFVFCFILKELDVYEPLGNGASKFVKEVKKIRDKLLLSNVVTQNDLSELCKYFNDSDTHNEITELFMKDSPDADVSRSYNNLVSWWKDEEHYGKKPVSKKQSNNKRKIIEEIKRFAENLDKLIQQFFERLGYQGTHKPFLVAYEAQIECVLKLLECNEKTAKELQEDITSLNDEDGEQKKESWNHFLCQLKLREIIPVEGCIILNITCSSIKNLLEFWDSCLDGRAVEALSKVRDYYKRYFNCDTLEFDVFLSKKGVTRCVNEIVEGLQSHFEGLISKVPDVHRILVANEYELPVPVSVETHAVGGEGCDGPASASVEGLQSHFEGLISKVPDVHRILVANEYELPVPVSVETQAVGGEGCDGPASASVEGLQSHRGGMISKVRAARRYLEAKKNEPLTPGPAEEPLVVGEECDFPASSSARAHLDKYLKDPGYDNWVKSGLALNITNEVLRPFVGNKITKLHRSIVQKLPSGVSCPGCSVNTLCPNGICDKIQREIEHEHWYPNPSFTNTFTGRWCTEPWEIAKCFIPPSKRYRTMSASDADFSASINVIINCKHFKAFGTSDPRITETDFSKAKYFLSSLMHDRFMKVSEHDMKENLNILINILNMVKTPETKAATEKAIEQIKQIKKAQLKIELVDREELKYATDTIADIRVKEQEKDVFL